MTEYSEYTVPAEMGINPLPSDLTEAGLNVLKDALAANSIIAKEVKIAYVFERKDEFSLDEFGTKRNKSYGSNGDDVLIQLTVRIPSPQNVNGLGSVLVLEEAVMQYRGEEERKQLEAEIAAAEQEAKLAQTVADQKRARLEALKAK